MKRLFHILLLFALAFNIYLLLEISVQYLAFDSNVGFLRIKQWVYDKQIWRMAFYTHVFSSIFLLLAGFTQFSGFIIRRYKKLHRTMGIFYVFILLLLSAPSGLIMSIYANGKLPAQISFTSLSILWIITTFFAYRTAIQKKFIAHGNWMVLSFALTLSAITLRLWKPFLAINFQIPPRDLYVIVSWLGWVPNFIIALVLIKFGISRRILQKR